jgi:hypothetical protein
MTIRKIGRRLRLNVSDHEALGCIFNTNRASNFVRCAPSLNLAEERNLKGRKGMGDARCRHSKKVIRTPKVIRKPDVDLYLRDCPC